MSDSPASAGAGEVTMAGKPVDPDRIREVAEAIVAARQLYTDFDLLEPVMETVGRALLPDWSRITVSEYVECLFVVARHSAFMRDVREALLLARTPPASARTM